MEEAKKAKGGNKKNQIQEEGNDSQTDLKEKMTKIHIVIKDAPDLKISEMLTTNGADKIEIEVDEESATLEKAIDKLADTKGDKKYFNPFLIGSTVNPAIRVIFKNKVVD